MNIAMLLEMAADGMGDRVAVMNHGQLLACDTPAAVMADAAVQAAYLGDPL